MRRNSFQVKLSLIFISLVVIILAISLFFTYQRVIQLQKAELRLRLLGLARLMSLYIDADKLMQVRPEVVSEMSPAYKQIRQILLKLKSTSPLVDSVYTMIKSDKPYVWHFLVDSGDKRKVVARCGEAFDVSGYPQMRVAFERPSVDEELTTDKYGVFLSAYAPIYDKQGKSFAIIGLDVRAESIKQMQIALTERFIAILLFGVFISLLLSWIFSRSLTKPIRSLMSGVRAMVKGDLEYKVTVKTRDELAELAEAFNGMSSELSKQKSQLQRYYIETIRALIRALESQDRYTSGHSERVARYAMHIARYLGLSDDEIKLLEEVASLHDIGKIGVPDGIIKKNGPLTKEEELQMRKHPAIGEEILRPIEFLHPGLSAVRDHHERQDGSGYPRGLKLEQISLFAAIAAVADSYDAMTSDRPYRKALSQEEAISVLEKNKDKQFNAKVVEVFVKHLKENKEKK